ncbi:hypothetical protein [Streptomyces blattellae]|uniref:hypothetical protein n=1 Tax=Streptomyces blattellae TaxID=2569855 RepID=UPI0012B7E540|nr:hypothetical protein [Streptomyces blattellae]
MYLIHVHLNGPPGAVLLAGIETLVWSVARTADRFEHIVVHPKGGPTPSSGCT